MCRKFIVFVSVAVLTGFILTSSANAADPNLLGWWKFDEGSGTTTADSSALGNNGTFGIDYNELPDSNNAPQWVGGRRGERALRFNRLDGPDFVNCGNDPNFDVNGPMTVMCWVRGPVSDLKMSAVAKGGDSWRLYCYNDDRINWYVDFLDTNEPNGYAWAISTRTDGMNDQWDGVWHHWVATLGKKDANNWEVLQYWDGEEQPCDSGNPVMDPNDWDQFAVDPNRLWISGQDTNDEKGERYWQGYIDDVRIYDYNLSQAQIQAIANQPYDIAHEPRPQDGAVAKVAVDGKVTLRWIESPNAVDHNIYFGTSSPPPFLKNQGPNSYEPNGIFEDGGVERGGTYYWQIEEDDANSSNTYKSPVWSFSVPDYIILDDFEAYGTNTQLRAVWVPAGTGYVSVDYTEDEQHEDGIRSMEIQYYGIRIEGERTLDSPTDFTSDGQLKALTLYFLCAGTNNDPEDFYVRLESADGNAATVFHPNNPNAVLPSDFWKEWNIDLEDFKQEPSSNDVNLADVNSIAIGIGDESYANNTGRVVIDDVRLYPSRCIFDEGPLGDMAGNTGDCKVDNKDLDLMSDDWLSQNPGLILWYKMDDTNGFADSNIVDDSSGRGYHGTINDPNLWLPNSGKIGGCVNLYDKDNIDVPVEVLSHIKDEITVAFWAYGNPNDPEPDCPDPDVDEDEAKECRDKDKADVVLHAKYAEDDIARIIEVFLPEPEVNNTGSATDDYRWGAGNPNDFDITTVSSIGNAEYRGGWNHFAFTKNAKTGVMTIYVNGDPNVGSCGNFAQIYGAAPWKSGQTGLRIGMKLDEIEDTHWYMFGLLDDFRIYDYALSESDIERLANATPQEPLSVERGNFDNDPNGMVNFQDYAELGNNWLKEQLWP